MHFFYLQPTDVQDTFLDEEESLHCIKVLRCQKNETIHLIDGKGGIYDAIITNEHAKNCAIRITKKIQQPLPKPIVHIAICPPKASDRLEFFIEKATEMGVAKITFLVSQRSERNKINKPRLEKIVCAAAKQSMRAFFPELSENIAFEKFLSQHIHAQKYIAHCNSYFPKTFLGKCVSLQENILILIGPEGDFSIQEIEQALALNYQSVSLSNFRLRTETAALVALNICELAKENDDTQ